MQHFDFRNVRHSLEDFVCSDQLPSLPQVVIRVIELAREPEPDFAEITAALRADPALAARILRTANSALFGLSQPVQSIEAAVPVLGMTMLRTIVLGFTLADHDSTNRDVKDASRKYWRSSLCQAVFAEQLASQTPGADASTWFLAGLLQDIGVLAAMHTDPDGYLDNIWDVSEFPNVVEYERRHYGFTHLDIGQQLRERWGLPTEMQDAMSAHHAHMQTAVDQAPLTTALQAAHLSASYFVNHRAGGRAMNKLVRFLHEHYDWSVEQAEAAIEETSLRVAEVAALFSFDVGANFCPKRVLSDARDLLTEIALMSQLQQQAPVEKSAEKDDAYRDPMTGVFNRRFMDRVLNKQIADEIKGRKPIGLLFLDVDRFKSINDTHGHRLGDEAICKVAEVLQNCVRKSDSVIRYGGDEFLVLLRDVSASTVRNIAERIRNDVAESRLAELDIRMTTSVGAVYYEPQPDDPLDANWLIDCVDHAMYDAKNNGGNQVELKELPEAQRLAIT